MNFPWFVTFRYYVLHTDTRLISMGIGFAFFLVWLTMQPHDFPDIAFAVGSVLGALFVTVVFYGLVFAAIISLVRTVLRFVNEWGIHGLGGELSGEVMSDAECLTAMSTTIETFPRFVSMDVHRLRPDQVDDLQKAVYATTGSAMSGYEVRFWFAELLSMSSTKIN